jgi:hypothetical protein
LLARGTAGSAAEGHCGDKRAKVKAGKLYKKEEGCLRVNGVRLRRGRAGVAPELERRAVKWREDVKALQGDAVRIANLKGLVSESRH